MNLPSLVTKERGKDSNMQREIRLTDEEWTIVMRCLNNGKITFQSSPEIRGAITDVQNRILTQLRCHEAIQTMAPACIMEGEKKDGTQIC